MEREEQAAAELLRSFVCSTVHDKLLRRADLADGLGDDATHPLRT